MINCDNCKRLPYCRNSVVTDFKGCKEFLQMTEKEVATRIRHSTHYKEKDE